MAIGHASALEGGLRNHRIDSIQEHSGTIPPNENFWPFADVVKRLLWSPDAGMVAVRGVGSVDVVRHETGPETHSLTIAFPLQGTIAAKTPVYDALYRDADGLMETRTIIDRERHSKGGASGDGTLDTYTVAEGAKAATIRLPGDPGSAEPIEAEIVYHCEKVRSYQISQPATACAIVVNAGEIAASEGTITVTVEDAGGGTSEAESLHATSLYATTTATYTDIASVELSDDITGTITIMDVGYGGNVGATLMTIYGKDQYNGVEGDLGVPGLNGSTRNATWGSDYEKFLGDSFTYDSGSLALDINSVELSQDNNLASTPRHNTLKQRITEGNRTVQVTATVLGESESHDNIMRHLRTATGDIIWTLNYSTLTVEDAALITPGDRVIEAEGAFMQLANVFEGTTIAIT